MAHENLTVKVVFLDMEEYRLLNGWSRDKKRGSHRYDRIPLDFIEEKELTADRLWQEITAITADPARLRRMADAMRAAAVLDADERIWQVIRSKLPKA